MVSIDRAVEILKSLEAADAGVHSEYSRGASQALACVMGYFEVGDAAQALLILATFTPLEQA
jgi:hypothetical protein